MTNDSNSYLELIQMIKNFVYDSKFKDLDIFSKQYLNSVLYNIYNGTDKYSLAFGDFDGLRDLNDKYTIFIGDQAMYDSLKIIKQILPPDTMIARASGDEFVFLSTSLTQKDWKQYIHKINSALFASKTCLHGLNITMSAIDSTISKDYDKLYNFVEADVSSLKHSSHQNDCLDKTDVLNDKILNGFRKYFSYYRLHKSTQHPYNLPDSFFDIASSSLTDILVKRFEQVDTPLKNYIDCLEHTLETNDTFLKYLCISKETAIQLNDLLIKHKKPNFKKLNLQELNNIYIFLVRDPLTGEFSKTFYKNYLLKKVCSEPQKQLHVRMFDLVHLKLSNDTVTHVKTDKKISELFYHITYALRSKIDYSDFNHDSGNYLVFYSGKLISIQNSNFIFSDNEIETILHGSRKNQQILDIVTSKKSGNNLELPTIIDTLSAECIEKKHDLKINKITSTETIIPLSIALEDSISYYIKNFPSPFALQSKQYLMQAFWNGLIYVINERFNGLTPMSKNIKPPNYFNDKDEH